MIDKYAVLKALKMMNKPLGELFEKPKKKKKKKKV